MKLTIYLGTDDLQSFDVMLYDNAFTKKWLQEFRWCLDNCKINQQESFSCLVPIEEAAETLKNSCLTINKYLKNMIEIRDSILEQPPEYFNYLHGIFEKLNGTFEHPSGLMQYAPDELKTAIRNLNLFIHVVEEKDRQQPRLHISFDKDSYRRIKFSDEDYQYFEFEIEPGTMFLNYAELGKDFLDLHQDKLPVDYSGFKNLHYYSGEANITLIKLSGRNTDNFKQWIKNQGFDPADKKLGHGVIPLGKVENLQDVSNLLTTHRTINKIVIKD